jgi:lipopolysaccharide transport system ATP-binding protein
MGVAIRVQGLSKKYILRHQIKGNSRYVSLRDVITNKAAALFKPRKGPNPESEDFWALRDVSFEVQTGEAIGVIGRNGAGKSTLLKLLSRITKPTEGRIELFGRVASLLEVGTGFHPELTGRENIYLNGSIMGMSRNEIRRRFDEIVDFAGVERFLDTPVKHFSSGMYVRLAFAVAAHLDPEILIVDEGLAVGDMQFQKKCLRKMEDVTAHDGRTVIFVSHNMDLISKLCTRAILLTSGQVTAAGPVQDITRRYLDQANVTQMMFKAKNPNRALRYALLDQEALMQDRLVLRIGFKHPHPVADPAFGMVIYTESGTPITASTTRYHPLKVASGNLVEGEVVVEFDNLPFWSERYVISIWINDGWIVCDHEDGAIIFEFIAQKLPPKTQSIQVLGPVHLPAKWTVVGPLQNFPD